MSAFGLAHLTALELSPPELVREAAGAGFVSIGLRVHPAMPGGVAYPLRVGSWAQRELRTILASEGVRLNEIEFIQLTPGLDIRSFAPLLEAGAELGAAAVTVSGDDADRVRLTASFAALCDLAAEFGLRVDLEFMRWRVVGTLAQAEAVVRQAGRPNGAVLVDALHLSRSGGVPGDLAALPRQFLRAAQLCDATTTQPVTDAEAITEAREGRLPPGEGALPLAALLQALPADAALSVELPMRGLDARSRIVTAYAATRRVLDGLPRREAPAAGNTPSRTKPQGSVRA
ncbi:MULTISPECIES: TIM barrel protein [unclassified Bosea (in: a-proteobacteria)]|uniref:sugar phosphate isomerase/epimerase family protein n=1 Tax=unclassified Bosea (in: a-proteobacteria) TaxID=2653178 RepID=UPI000F764ABB|nr:MULTISPECIES: TIM barrel protein [unclassified Bosea (in: a-proteobacteria)]AZO79100.1 xylose isomerase [Bosea sp. Tri-49]RXT27506.1 xylose isomerase [Bosea sp. Tri-39]RXT35789.1 xylose isomerase [Bosea sp. Tri-54]